MGMALAVTVAVGLVGSSLTWLWFRMSNDRPADPDIESLVKQRRATFEENVQSAEKLIRKG
ncbi:hypothetical protein [Oligoflexus tunisiensis]|uniref:hypothetical protein n=1 Tax=Oligoflexus tunisiensis TaxID=708132 RepID=UPI00114CB541|nr:hypothetical protein [Oligoflexus tunisiensis]